MKKGIVRLVLELVLGAAVIMLMGHWFEGVYVKNFEVAFLVALVLTLLNTFLKPILTFITLPITILTLGLFQLIVNGAVLSIATAILAPDFQISSSGLTIVVALCISIIYSLLGIGKVNE